MTPVKPSPESSKTIEDEAFFVCVVDDLMPVPSIRPVF